MVQYYRKGICRDIVIGRKYKGGRNMKHIKLFILTIISILIILQMTPTVALADRHFLSEYTQVLYDNNNLLPVSEANHILQTKDGYIWIATYSGLLRFDGKTVKQYSHSLDGDFPSDTVMTIFEDSKNRLWIGTNDVGLVLMENGEFTIIGRNEGLGSNTVRDIEEDPVGNIVVATTHGIYRVDKDKKVKQVNTIGLGDYVINSIAIQADGVIWAVSNYGIAYYIDSEGSHNLNTYSGIEAPVSVDVIDNKVYIGTSSNTIYVCEKIKEIVVVSTLNTDKLQGIQHVYQDSNNHLWVCADNGIGYFEDGTTIKILEGAKIENSVENVIEDYEGNLWFTSSRQGVLKLVKSSFKNIGYLAEQQDVVVNTTCLVNGKLYIGTDNGLMIIDQQTGKMVRNQLTSMLSWTRIRDIYQDSKGNIWICTYGKYGLIKIKLDGTYTCYNKEENEAFDANKVRCIIEREDGTMAVGTSQGIYILQNDEVVKKYGPSQLQNTVILSLLEKDGILYAGTDGGGIYQIEKDQSVVSFNKEKDFSEDIILRIAEDQQGDGLFIAASCNLYYYDCKTGKVQFFENLQMKNFSIFDIVTQNEKTITLIHSNGVSIVNREQLFENEKVKFANFNSKNGLSSSPIANSFSYVDEDGTVYMSCAKGVNAFNVNDIYTNIKKPKVQINGVVVDEKEIPVNDTIKISNKASRVEIDLGILTYDNARDCAVTYFLEGFDKKEQVINDEEIKGISYTNLPGGKYTFYVKVKRNVLGQKEEDITTTQKVTIIKAKKLTEHPSFWVFLIFAIGALVIFAVKSYIKRKLKAMQKRQLRERKLVQTSMEAIANTIDAKDPYTNGHSRRVAEYAVMIAKELELDTKFIEDLYYIALLHDIGKIGVPDKILTKPGKLDDEEYNIIKKHTTIGGDILKEVEIIKGIQIGARYHHERYDGKGYPEGLKGDDIPFIARIIGVADAYDAMTADRPYRKGMSNEVAIDEIKKGAGTQFDPTIAKVMITLIENKLQDKNE